MKCQNVQYMYVQQRGGTLYITNQSLPFFVKGNVKVKLVTVKTRNSRWEINPFFLIRIEDLLYFINLPKYISLSF